MIHVIPHHIAKGSYSPWYDIIKFNEDVIYHKFEDAEEIERKLLGEPPYEDRLISHLKKINPNKKDIVIFDYQYVYNDYPQKVFSRLNQLSSKFNNCKFVLFDDDNRCQYTDTERFTIFSNIFSVEYKDGNLIHPYHNCNYYRYRAKFQDYIPHIEYVIDKFNLNIRQKKCNLFVGVDKLERLEILKYFFNINLNTSSYIAYSGFMSTYSDNQISESLQKFKKETLPIILDTPFEMSQMGSVNVEIPPIPFTLNSYFSCILETQLLDGGLIHLSEKSWNPFISKNIPLILGSSLINQYLMSIGFWLADDLFDISPKFNRTDIINQYKSNLDIINNMSLNDIHHYYHTNIGHIEHNYGIIKNINFIFDSNNYNSIYTRNL
jgi:hypothetical protein